MTEEELPKIDVGDLHASIEAVKEAAVEATTSIRAAADSLSGRKPFPSNRAGRRAAERAKRKRGR